MIRVRVWSGVLGLIFLSACANLPVKLGGLEVTVAPEIIHPGDVVKILVKAPAGTREVWGRLDVPGSPRVPLKTRDQGSTWTFITQIPLDAIWKPGQYRAQVRGTGPEGNELAGETWITAP
jgi:hypothetical protein